MDVENALMKLLAPAQWHSQRADHRARVERYTAPYLDRRSRNESHPVEDFLFTYYTLKPAQLRRWHPGAGVVVLDADSELSDAKFYRRASVTELAQSEGNGAAPIDPARSALVDVDAFLSHRGTAVAFARDILSRTAQSPANFSCFGLHEWAMAYHSEQTPVRHSYLPLRLGASGTDDVVESHSIRCTHFDAFRFYHPDAKPLNELTPSRERQRELEQPGCLHANMDLYKWAYKLLPLISSETVMECFDLAWEVRRMDMRAAPYDLEDWGYSPIAIETPEGKAEYVSMQRSFALRSAQLRHKLLEELDAAVGDRATKNSMSAVDASSTAR